MHRIASRSIRGPGRTRNEDHALVRAFGRGRSLLAVADGMGGAEHGERASACAIRVLDTAVQRDVALAPSDMLSRAFSDANRAVRRLGASHSPERRPGTTLVAVILSNGSCWVANVGDSRAYLVDDGGSHPLTRDHSWAEREVRAGLMLESDAAASPLRNVLTRNLGGAEQVGVDVFGPRPVAAGTRVVLCSDGLYSMINDEELACAAVVGAPELAASRLLNLAQARGGQDDITVIVAEANGRVAGSRHALGAASRARSSR